MDIAQLAYEVDSSGLVQGNRALDENVKAAERASDAAAELEDRYRRIAQEGIAYAESMRTANVSERAAAEAQRESASALNSRAMLMARGGTEAERMAARVERLQASEARAAAATEASARATELQELNLKKLLGQIDPTIAKLDRLADMERRLEKARDLGAINPQVFDQYQAKLDATRAATLNVGAASDTMTQSLGSLNLQSVETQQSVAALARALATGQWGQAQASITSLTARTGVMSAAFSTTGLMIGGAGAALGGFTVLAAQGYMESRRLEGSIIATGDAAVFTTRQLMEMRGEIGRATGDYAGTSEALQQLILSGKASADVLEGMAEVAVRMSRLTGQSVGSATSELLQLVDSGEEGLIRLNDKLNFLTVETYRNIEAVREQDGEMAALRVTIEELQRSHDERAARMAETAGLVEVAWKGVKGAIDDAMESVRDFGRTDASGVARQMEEFSGRRGILGGIRALTDVHVPALGTAFDLVAPHITGALDAVAAAHEEAEQAAAQQRAAAKDAVNAESEAAREQREAAERMADLRRRHFSSETKMLEEIGILRRDAALAGTDAAEVARLEAEIRERYAKRERDSGRERIQRLSEEERAVERLLAKFSGQETAMERQIALYGDTSRSAAIAYDIQVSGLRAVNAELADTLSAQAAWLDWMDEMAEVDKIISDIQAEHRKRTGEVDREMDAMSEYARQAARNMQSHFADFLFDPFADGTKSMGEQFSQTLRRMMAEAAASRIFEVLGGALAGYTGRGAGFINAVGGVMQGGGREYGGDVYARHAHRVGERNKPELLTTPSGQYLIPGENGRVDPIRAVAPSHGARMGAPQININLHGAPEGTTATARPNTTGGFDIDVIVQQIEGRMAQNVAGGTGSLQAAMKGRFGLRDVV